MSSLSRLVEFQCQQELREFGDSPELREQHLVRKLMASECSDQTLNLFIESMLDGKGFSDQFFLQVEEEIGMPISNQVREHFKTSALK